jgi:hypothetical protein
MFRYFVLFLFQLSYSFFVNKVVNITFLLSLSFILPFRPPIPISELPLFFYYISHGFDAHIHVPLKGTLKPAISSQYPLPKHTTSMLVDYRH